MSKLDIQFDIMYIVLFTSNLLMPMDVFNDLLITEPENKELQEAVSKTTYQHDLTNLEPATTYSIYLKAYSPVGASQESSTVVATTLGGGM